MKRCPHCQFIHLDQDEFCEFDGALLQVVDDAELTEAAPIPNNKQRSIGRGKKRLAIVVAAAAALSATLTIGYLGLSGRFSRNRETNTPAVASQTVPQPVIASVTTAPTPDVSPSPAPEADSAASVRAPSPPRTEVARGVVSRNPVSTGNENNAGTAVVRIRLMNGATVEADEVWRTKEGVWYRRNGMVTLLKRDRVKAIERSSSPK